MTPLFPMEKKAWKILTVVLVIVLVLALSLMAWIFHEGKVQMKKESVCAYDICGLREGEHDSYFYAPDEFCFCFEEGNLDFVEDVNDFLD